MRKNSKVKNILKVFIINLTVLGILLVSPALLYRLYKKLVNSNTDQRAFYPNYSNKDFSIELFNEYSKLPVTYRSFIGWRREKVNFKYTKILGQYNARKSKGEAINNSVWFFGGSTMWGTGSSDNQTIPSHFNSLTNLPVYNFGETGWNSRQSLNQLINAIGDKKNPSVAIFYDGVNDIIHQCRSEVVSLPSHMREIRLQNALKPLPIQNLIGISNFLLTPYIKISREYSIQLPFFDSSISKRFDCDINEGKALLIAQHLVNNWYTAHVISKSKNFEFYGILQPTLFSTKTKSDYFPPDIVKQNSEIEIQYKKVYPLILKEIDKYCAYDKNFCSKIIDGTDWLDGTNNIFIDFCHLNSHGNKVIAQRIKSLLEKIKTKDLTFRNYQKY